MKHLLFFATLLFSTTLLAQNIDTVVTYEWVNNAWQPDTKSITSFDNSCRPSTVLTQNWQTSSSTWADTALSTFTYNADNKLQEILIEMWNGSGWDSSLRETLFYNNNNLTDTILSEVYISGNWKNATLITYAYNGDQTVHQTVTKIWTGSSWFNNTRNTYSYNADKTVSELITETYVLSWTNAARHAYTYNADKKVLTDTAQAWASNQWKNNLLTTSTYDGSGYLINELTQLWDNASSTYENESQSNYTNNADGTPSIVISQTWDTNTSTWVNESKTTYHYSVSCSLPLTLLDFTATLDGKAAKLQWTTVSESNTKNFVVQRSTDGAHFSSIGTVAAAGNSTEKITYRFSDASAFSAGANKVYYRLQMVDKDGKYTFSKIAFVSVINGQLFVIYPNPVKDKLVIKAGISLTNVGVRITDLTGKVVLTSQIGNLTAGVENPINVSSLNKGLYYLQLFNGTTTQTIKFYKY